MLNIHATALVVGDRGLLILGPAGSGKTTLALALVDYFSSHGKFSRLVGDDQLFVEARAGLLLALAPPAIAGLVEVWGLGPRPVRFEPEVVLDLAVRLVPADQVERLQERAVEIIAGCSVPLIRLAERTVAAALPMVAACLEKGPFRAD